MVCVLCECSPAVSVPTTRIEAFSPIMKIGRFLAELKRRNVYKTAAAYAVVAWLLVQVATQVAPFFDIPSWTVRLIVVLMLAGLPVAVVGAWAFELTPEGLKRTDDVPPSKSIAARTGRKLIGITAILAAIAVALLLFQTFRPKAAKPNRADVPESVAVAPPQPSATTIPDIPERSIAVLPLASLSSDGEVGYVADGIQDEILTMLAGIPELKVISRTSTETYKSHPENLRAVSRELGVANILEGSVQRNRDSIRVNVQLIDARRDVHLWAKSFDREIKDVFQVESQIAQEIAAALHTALSPELIKPPTYDSAAYDMFLRGESQLRRGDLTHSADAYERAIALYKQALERQPTFGLAAAKLAEARLGQHVNIRSLTDADLNEIQRLVESALKTDPNLAELHIAMGLLRSEGYGDDAAALPYIERALQLEPSNTRARMVAAYIYRARGQFDALINDLTKAYDLDRRETRFSQMLGQVYSMRREWDEAKRFSRIALSVDPRNSVSKEVLAMACIGSGDIDGARAALLSIDATRVTSGDIREVAGAGEYVHLLQRDFDGAIREATQQEPDPQAPEARFASIAAIRVVQGANDRHKHEFGEALKILEQKVTVAAEHRATQARLAWTYTALERHSDALRVAGELVLANDAYYEPMTKTFLAEIQAHTGQQQQAIAELRRLLAAPAGLFVSINRLKIDPVWDPLRGYPEFQQLLKTVERVGSSDDESESRSE